MTSGAKWGKVARSGRPRDRLGEGDRDGGPEWGVVDGRRRGAGQVFLGEYQHTIDEKGRLVLPRKFRDALEDGLVITKGQDRCLFVFTPDRWEIEAEKVNRLPRTDRRIRAYARSFFASASDQGLDRQGRVQIPTQLREYASLDRDVLVVGVAERVEIWDAEAWRQLSAEADEVFADIEEALSEEGI